MSRSLKHWFSKLHPVLIWWLATLFYFYKNILEVSPGVMSNDFMRAFHVDGTQLGNIAAGYFYSYMLMQIPVGVLVDRFSPRHLTAFAIAVCAAGCIVLSDAHGMWSATFGRFVTGLGAAFAAVSCFKLTTVWFDRHRFALMAGLMMAVGMIGSVGGVAPLSDSIHLFGWRDTLYYLAIAGFGLAIIFWTIVRDEGPYLHNTNETQQSALFDGLIKVIRNPQTWHLSWYSGLAFAPMMVFGGLWGVPYLQSAYHMSHAEAAREISMTFIGFAIGAPVFGWLSDLLGRRKPIMICGTILGLLLITYVLYWPNINPIVLSIALLIFGTSISTFLLCFSMIRELNTFALTATAVGFMNAFDALLGAISDPMIGKFLDLGWKGEMIKGARVFPLPDFKLALLTLPLYLALSIVFLLFIKETYCKPIGK